MLSIFFFIKKGSFLFIVESVHSGLILFFEGYSVGVSRQKCLKSRDVSIFDVFFDQKHSASTKLLYVTAELND